MQDKLEIDIEHKILVVDDMPSQTMVLSAILEELGYEVHVAGSGKEAIEATNKEKYSVILLDVYMPDMDGFRVAEILRGNEATENIPIIFVTATAVSKELEFTGYTKGAVDFIYKPVSQEALLGKVRWLIALQEESMMLKRTLVKIKQVNRQNELLINNALQGILWVNSDGLVHMANPAALKILDYKASDMHHSDIKDYLFKEQKDTPINWEEFVEDLVELEEHGNHSEDVWFKKASSHVFQVELNSSVILDENNESEGVVLIFEDITKRKQEEESLRHQAQYDALTGLANRNKLISAGADVFAKVDKYQSTAIVFIDLDGFKAINDNFGHEAGDQVLIDVAKILNDTVEGNAVIARLGGDEFAVLVPHVEDKERLTINFNEVVVNIARINKVFGSNIVLSASVGIAVYPDAGDDFDALLKSAYQAMYNAKQQGKNRVCFYSENNQDLMERSLKIINTLTDFNIDNFVSHYQYIYDTSSNTPAFIEAFLALKIGEGELVKAEEFIKHANKLLILEKVFDWQVDKIFSDLSEKKDIKISLNLTCSQILNLNIMQSLITRLYSSKIDRSSVYIDIDVSDIANIRGDAIEVIKNLKNYGFNVALENFDFASGISNEVYSLVDMIKVSKCLVDSVGSNSEKDKILKTIFYLCDQFDVEITGAGVDSKEKQELLISLGAKYLQGAIYPGDSSLLYYNL